MQPCPACLVQAAHSQFGDKQPLKLQRHLSVFEKVRKNVNPFVNTTWRITAKERYISSILAGLRGSRNLVWRAISLDSLRRRAVAAARADVPVRLAAGGAERAPRDARVQLQIEQVRVLQLFAANQIRADDRPLPAWRRLLMYPCQIWGRVMLFAFGEQ